jgi:hypothetical protein
MMEASIVPCTSFLNGNRSSLNGIPIGSEVL